MQILGLDSPCTCNAHAYSDASFYIYILCMLSSILVNILNTMQFLFSVFFMSYDISTGVYITMELTQECRVAVVEPDRKDLQDDTGRFEKYATTLNYEYIKKLGLARSMGNLIGYELRSMMKENQRHCQTASTIARLVRLPRRHRRSRGSPATPVARTKARPLPLARNFAPHPRRSLTWASAHVFPASSPLVWDCKWQYPCPPCG